MNDSPSPCRVDEIVSRTTHVASRQGTSDYFCCQRMETMQSVTRRALSPECSNILVPFRCSIFPQQKERKTRAVKLEEWERFVDKSRYSYNFYYNYFFVLFTVFITAIPTVLINHEYKTSSEK